MKKMNKFLIVFIVLMTIVSISAISAADNDIQTVESDCGDSLVSDGETPSQASPAVIDEPDATDAVPTASEDTDNTEKPTIGPEQGNVGETNNPTTIDITSNNTSKVGDKVRVSVIITDEKGVGVTGGNTTLLIIDANQNIVKNETKAYTYGGIYFGPWYPNKAGIYTVSIKYAGYPVTELEPSEANQTFTVTSGDSTPTTTTITSGSSSKVGEQTTITATVFADKTAVSLGNVTLTISKDGKTVYTDTKTLSSTGLSFDWTPTAVGTYNVLVNYNGFNSGNVNYAPSQASQTYKVTGDSTYQLIVKNVNMYYADGTKLVVKVLNDAGKPVKNVAVHVKINGKTHKLLTNNKGLADLALNLNPKKYTVVSTIPDTDVKTKSTYTVNKWKKSLTSFTVQSMAKAFKTAKPFRVLLKHNNVPAAGQTINVQVGPRTFKIKTNSKGIASLAVCAKPGIYTAKVSMNVAGVKLTKVANIIVTNWKKQYARLKVSKVEDVLQNGSTQVIGFKAHLTYDGENIAQQPIFFILNNKIYESITNNNGLAYCKLHQKSGTYNGYALTKVTTVTLITVLRGDRKSVV